MVHAALYVLFQDLTSLRSRFRRPSAIICVVSEWASSKVILNVSNSSSSDFAIVKASVIAKGPLLSTRIRMATSLSSKIEKSNDP